MDLLAWLIVGHLVGDFLFQTRWMAENKASHWDALLIHCALYTLIIAIFAWPLGGLSWPALLFVFLGHIALDRRGFTKFWLKNINRTDDIFWLIIVHDQTWHLLILALAVFWQTMF